MTWLILVTPSLFGQAQSGPGGSNFAWYYVDNNCNREPYGVIANYNTAATTINSILQSMYNNGQRRLRIPIYHGRGLGGGTVMDSSGGNLSAQNRSNFTNLLMAAANVGFVEVEVGFFPVGPNDPNNWSTYSEDYYQENWNLIANLYPILGSTTMAYRIDLLNEGIPASGSQTAKLQYDQHLWNNFVYVFGKEHTVGFSIPGPNTTMLGQIPNVYGNSQYGNHGYPYLYDVHLYENPQSSFLTVYNTLTQQGYNPGWIIGESYYNNLNEAQAFNAAQSMTGQTVFYITQWPLQEGASCSETGINVGAPVLFDGYTAYGY